MNLPNQTIMKVLNRGQAPPPPLVQDSRRHGNGDLVPGHTEGERQRTRRLSQDADTVVQAGWNRLVSSSRNMTGVQPCACI